MTKTLKILLAIPFFTASISYAQENCNVRIERTFVSPNLTLDQPSNTIESLSSQLQNLEKKYKVVPNAKKQQVFNAALGDNLDVSVENNDFNYKLVLNNEIRVEYHGSVDLSSNEVTKPYFTLYYHINYRFKNKDGTTIYLNNVPNEETKRVELDAINGELPALIRDLTERETAFVKSMPACKDLPKEDPNFNSNY